MLYVVYSDGSMGWFYYGSILMVLWSILMVKMLWPIYYKDYITVVISVRVCVPFLTAYELFRSGSNF